MNKQETHDARLLWELRNVVIGYSTDQNPMEDWEEHGMMCGYEHCIETMPLTGGCLLFGHECPGGVEQMDACRKVESAYGRD